MRARWAFQLSLTVSLRKLPIALGAAFGAGVPCQLLWLQAQQIGDRRRAPSSSALLAPRLVFDLDIKAYFDSIDCELMPGRSGRWTLHHRSDKSLPKLAEMYNPCIRGWINYYSNFTERSCFDPEED